MAAVVSNVDYIFEGRECFVEITQSEATPTTVYINGFAKVVTEQQQRINITPYLLAQLTLSPERHNALNNGNAVIPTVTINGATYASDHAFVCGTRNISSAKASDLPYRLIAVGQIDYIYAFCEAGGSVEILTNRVLRDNEVNYHQASSLLAVGYYCAEGESVALQAKTSDGDIVYSEHIKYIIRPMALNGKRLAWVNKYGAIDFWNFDYLREQNFVSSSEVIYTTNGYRKINAQAEKQYTIETKELTQQALEALSFIICAPKVWVVTDDIIGAPTFEEVQIITEECRVYSDSELSALQIVYRPIKRDV